MTEAWFQLAYVYLSDLSQTAALYVHRGTRGLHSASEISGAVYVRRSNKHSSAFELANITLAAMSEARYHRNSALM